jgi:hypothetical protein
MHVIRSQRKSISLKRLTLLRGKERGLLRERGEWQSEPSIGYDGGGSSHATISFVNYASIPDVFIREREHASWFPPCVY